MPWYIKGWSLTIGLSVEPYATGIKMKSSDQEENFTESSDQGALKCIDYTSSKAKQEFAKICDVPNYQAVKAGFRTKSSDQGIFSSIKTFDSGR